jgi:site-specific DNA recombinase
MVGFVEGVDRGQSLLRNRFYIAEVVFKGEVCLAEHPPILDRDLFEAVQRKLAEQHNGYHATRRSSDALLMGRIFDDRGNRMTPSHSRKEGMRHRYYVSAALVQGRPEAAGSVPKHSQFDGSRSPRRSHRSSQ